MITLDGDLVVSRLFVFIKNDFWMNTNMAAQNYVLCQELSILHMTASPTAMLML